MPRSADSTTVEDGTNFPFSTVVESALLGIYQFSNSPPFGSFNETFVVTWTNFSTSITVTLGPTFLLEPQSRAFSPGTDLVLSTKVAHANIFQWQKNGVNLTNDARID